MPFPEDGLVYDYCLDDGGVSKTSEEEEEEGEKKKTKVHNMHLYTQANFVQCSCVCVYGMYMCNTMLHVYV